MKVGLLGGTFDPIHKAHLMIARETLAKYSLDEIVFIPSMPPHKDESLYSPAEHRVNMTKLAVEDIDQFSVSTYEADKKETSYTIDTIKHFKNKHPEKTELFFIIGADWADGICTWKDYDLLKQETSFIVFPRKGYVISKSMFEDAKVYTPEMREVNISSSSIRNKIQKAETWQNLVPEKVFDYIQHLKLYR